MKKISSLSVGQSSQSRISEYPLDWAKSSVENIIDGEENDIILLNEEELRKFIFDYIIRQMRYSKGSEDKEFATRYITNLIFDMMMFTKRAREIIEKPYFHDWMQKGRYSRAGDVGTVGYLFYHLRKTDFTSKHQYLRLAATGYSSAMSNRDVVKRIVEIIPNIEQIGSPVARVVKAKILN